MSHVIEEASRLTYDKNDVFANSKQISTWWEYCIEPLCHEGSRLTALGQWHGFWIAWRSIVCSRAPYGLAPEPACVGSFATPASQVQLLPGHVSGHEVVSGTVYTALSYTGHCGNFVSVEKYKLHMDKMEEEVFPII
jgi:hypothetical protein